MTLRVLLSTVVRALPVVGPFMRHIDMLTIYVLKHEAELDLNRAKASAPPAPPVRP